ncbi:hypothetical protein PF010_g16042 [Phytophthora fragariae]|uniref:Uncharacterized protein n=2 Tax=Phytophthora TaxID=4783 RepID=A0A6A3SFU0_9STRA|nr:hypothetical protein PF003_g36108 [Phytophthora fragariae]KAE8975586.1 hypothetical protein PR002_g25567 [Phytophthora rubi]KAE9000849.1 hypothetical protein PF011_g14006 [Phytophthora fragariae]KAE9097227.1 hypothetical protein PF010_g16042 [Phytophthora fragariae]KAE9116111.1 hypothetical protein PF007_g9778 [Phytophthora fragariae]
MTPRMRDVVDDHLKAGATPLGCLFALEKKYDDNPEMLRELPTATHIKSRGNYLRNKAENGWFVPTYTKLL